MLNAGGFKTLAGASWTSELAKRLIEYVRLEDKLPGKPKKL
jgi:hypothetical protein